MQNLAIIYAGDIRQTGRIFVPAGRARTAFIDARDVGRVAATVLTQPGHLRRAYTLSGEESLTYRHVARTMTEVPDRVRQGAGRVLPPWRPCRRPPELPCPPHPIGEPIETPETNGGWAAALTPGPRRTPRPLASLEMREWHL